MQTLVLFLVLLALPPSSPRAEPMVTAPRTLDELRARLEQVRVRPELLSPLWEELREAGRIPFVEGPEVAFLYRGEARQVGVTGDFCGWEPDARTARRIEGTDLWVQEESFPLTARLDYKIVVDGDRWILDPENPRTQRGGFGPNSELRMPGYEPSPWVERKEGIARGTLSAPVSLASAALGYRVAYQVYLPAGYDGLTDLPTIYVTDGHEYAADDMGSMVIVLDNLIAAGRLAPLLAVFVDPRVGGRNLRGEQYVLSPDFARFFDEELIPRIDRDYHADPDPTARAILGTSLGGLNAAWLGIRLPHRFGLLAIQSPAFQAGEGRILGLYRESPPLRLRIHMSWGTFFDFGAESLRMERLLRDKGYDLTSVTVEEGHSWGSWRALLDDALLHFWGR